MVKKIAKKFAENGNMFIYRAVLLDNVKPDETIDIDISKPIAFSKLSALELLANSEILEVGNKVVIMAIGITDEDFIEFFDVPEESVNGDRCVIQPIKSTNLATLNAEKKLVISTATYTVDAITYTEDSTDTYKEIAAITLIPQLEGDTLLLGR